MGTQRFIATITRYDDIVELWLVLDYSAFALDNLREINLYVVDLVINVGLILFQPEISCIVARAKRDNVHLCAFILSHKTLQDLSDGVNTGPRPPINDREHLLLIPRKKFDKLVLEIVQLLSVNFSRECIV